MHPNIKNKIETSFSAQVNLNNMRITDAEIGEIMSFVVQTKPQVKKILLDDNLLSDEGAQILANKLAELQGLTWLSLESNRLDRTSIKAVYFLMKNNPQLKFSPHGNIIRDVREGQEIKEAVLKELKGDAPTSVNELPFPSKSKKKSGGHLNIDNFIIRLN